MALADDIDDKVDIFTSLLTETFNKHAPSKSVSFKSRPAPWLSYKIREQMRERDIKRRKWRKNGSAASYDHFKVLRNKVQNLIRTAKSNYYLAAFNQVENTKVVWKKLRHSGLIKDRKGNKSNLVHSVEDLNEFFIQVSNEEDTTQHQDFNCSYEDTGYNDMKLYWSYITPQNIHKALSRIHSDSAGVDDLSLKLIKLVKFACRRSDH